MTTSDKKRCASCGTVQNADRTTCVECGAVLPKKMSRIEAEAEEKNTSEMLSDMSDHADPFYVPTWAKIAAVCMALLGIAALVLRILRIYPMLLAPICAVFAVIYFAFPRAIWAIDLRRRIYGIEEPSFVYIIMIRVGGIIFSVCEIAAFVMSITMQTI